MSSYYLIVATLTITAAGAAADRRQINMPMPLSPILRIRPRPRPCVVGSFFAATSSFSQRNNSNYNEKSVRSILHDIRGGEGDGTDDDDNNGMEFPEKYYSRAPPFQQQHNPNSYTMRSDAPSTATSEWSPSSSTSTTSAVEAIAENYYDDDDDYMGNTMNAIGAHPPSNDMYEYSRESVEERIDAWRRQQQQLQQQSQYASSHSSSSAVDETGRFKLFTAVSRVSVSFFFFILMWRTVHHYELADATFGTIASISGSSHRGGGGGFRHAVLRATAVTPLVVLFLGEMMGAILGLIGGGAGGGGGGGGGGRVAKRRLKGILNLHKFVELTMLLYNVTRLALWPSRYVAREVYIGRTISNFFFLMQAQLYTKLSWEDVSETSGGNHDGSYVTESYYDDYVPDGNSKGGTKMFEEEDSIAWQQPGIAGDGAELR